MTSCSPQRIRGSRVNSLPRPGSGSTDAARGRGGADPRLAKARVDVAVIIGDDQREMFCEGIGVFGVFLGDELVDQPPRDEALERVAKGIRAAYWARHSERRPCTGRARR